MNENAPVLAAWVTMVVQLVEENIVKLVLIRR